MTLCIAAECWHDGKHAIALCCDWQGTYGDFVKSDDVYKMRWPSGEFSIMISGTGSSPDELVSLLDPVIKTYDKQEKSEETFDLRISKFLEDIRVVVRRRKDALVNHYLAMKYNISYLDFLKNGKDWFPPNIYAAILSEIQYVRLGCDLLLSYADDTEPVIIEIREDGHVGWIDNYLCIGTGSTIALSFLCQDDWPGNIESIDALTRIYMAKAAAHKDPYVGQGTSFAVLVNGQKAIDLTTDGRNFVAKQSKHLQFPAGLKAKASFFEVLGEEEETAIVAAAENVTPISEAQAP